LQAGSLAFLAAYARRWPGACVELPLIAGIEKRHVPWYGYADDDCFFSAAGCERPDTAVNTERFIFVPTDE